MSASAVWIGFWTTQDCRRQKILCMNTLTAIFKFTPPHQTRQDRRACLSTAAAATQARQAATPSRPTAHTQRRCTPRKCKHDVDYCIWLGLNFFTKGHATSVIYRLTVQTLPDHLETQFTPPVASGGWCELGLIFLRVVYFHSATIASLKTTHHFLQSGT